MASKKKAAARPRMRTVCVVKARCIQCKTIRVVSEDEVQVEHTPVCKKCFGMLIAISATIKKVPASQRQSAEGKEKP